ncbi:Putative negative regulator of RcsB-dependent stress response [Desulfatibacillum alkenivorans DSM 16219]|jgi:predicted negative regulator of RcsB-dependent stress response|uniref:Putative negative regulator of RcsB-dependent stress response n=1 Tax=Desulfatibacillum alkenivorans DSM 16219 TaxID=1121393 RepID=A0A1M6IHR3_9BACT|nr:tetratricopeptide repeat protein [Desulfatibacillum alkenivorans]SHJ33969.1 Putative negative regulator of RcsB-dependent stress response [Desulfatibacillum alkenivorans DSM 16219]
MANAKRISRKELLNEPDEFITMTGKVVNWCRDHEKELYTAGVIVALLVVIISGWTVFSARTESKASTMFSAAQAKYAGIMTTSSDAKQAAVAVNEDFKNVAQEYSGTDAGKLATLMVGQTAYDAGDYDEAIEWWNKSLKALSGDPIESSRALLGLGYAYEQKADYDKALEMYNKVLAVKMGLGKEEAALAVARIYEVKGDAGKSVQAYEKFAADYPGSAYAQMVKEKLAASAS